MFTARIAAARDCLRHFYDEQIYLQQRHIDRLDVTGLEALTAQRTLRWDRDRLRGDLPPVGPGPWD